MSIGIEQLQQPMYKLLQQNTNDFMCRSLIETKIILSKYLAIIERYSHMKFFSNITKSLDSSTDDEYDFPEFDKLISRGVLSKEEVIKCLKNIGKVRNATSHIISDVKKMSYPYALIKYIEENINKVKLKNNLKVAENDELTMYGFCMLLAMILPNEDRNLILHEIGKYSYGGMTETEKADETKKYSKLIEYFSQVERKNKVNEIKDILTSKSMYKNPTLSKIEGTNNVIITKKGKAFLNIIKTIMNQQEVVIIENALQQTVKTNKELLNIIFEIKSGQYSERVVSLQENLLSHFEENYRIVLIILHSMIGDSIFNNNKEIEVIIKDGVCKYIHKDNIGGYKNYQIKVKLDKDQCLLKISDEKTKQSVEFELNMDEILPFIIVNYAEPIRFMEWLILRDIKEFSQASMSEFFNKKIKSNSFENLIFRNDFFFTGQEQFFADKNSEYISKFKDFYIATILPNLIRFVFKLEETLLKNNSNMIIENKKDYLSFSKITKDKKHIDFRNFAMHGYMPNDRYKENVYDSMKIKQIMQEIIYDFDGADKIELNNILSDLSSKIEEKKKRKIVHEEEKIIHYTGESNIDKIQEHKEKLCKAIVAKCEFEKIFKW